MSSNLHRLVYYSRNLIGGDRDDIAEHIEQILRTSRTNNTRCGVTGALLFNGGCFAQILEGSAAAVSETFERIQCDPRHGEVLVLEFVPTQSRSFPNWSMAFVGADPAGETMFGGISSQSQFDPTRLTADQIFGAMRRLLLEEEGSAAA